MYLNIINNSVFENRRKKNKVSNTHEDDNENLTDDTVNKDFSSLNKYKSIFYGELTKNWLSINQ